MPSPDMKSVVFLHQLQFLVCMPQFSRTTRRVSTSHVLHISQKRQQKEIACGEVSSSNDPSHSFRVYRVAGKEETCHARSHGKLRSRKDLVGQPNEQVGGQAVEEDVDEMVAPWLEAAEEVV